MKNNNNKIKTIVICSSASFYKEVIDTEKKLKELGFKVKVPLTATKMKKSGDFKVETYKTWTERPEDYKRKAYLTKKHFIEIEKGDITLVLNYKKNGKNGYIGGAVLMEMAIAFNLNKPIFILNPIDDSSKYKEELYGMFPKIINGDLSKII
jgi:hypothetical protein